MLAVLALGASPKTAASQGFTYQFIFQDLFPVNFGDAAWGDLNRDGLMDLVITGLAELDLDTPIGTTFINQGEEQGFDNAGNVIFIQNYLPQGRGVRAAWLSDASWTDVDRNGFLEFMIAGASSTERPYEPSTRMYLVTGSEFTEIELGLPGVFGGSIDWGDFDNDGDDDLLLTGDTEAGLITRIFERVGGASPAQFQDSGIRMTDVSLGDARFFDYDNDADLDVILTGDTGAGFVTKLYNNEAGEFSEVPQAFAPLGFSSIDVGDYDNDGDLDVLLAGGVLSPLIVEGRGHVYRNDGNGTFTDINAEIDGTFYGAAKWGDYDNDGSLDIMLSGAANVQSERIGRLYRNEGQDQFRFAINLSGLLFSEAALGDYDYDNDLDILQVGSGRAVQYRNDQLRINEPPTIPQDLSVAVGAGTAALSWSGSTDPQTPTEGLTYNIRVGTSPGGVNVVAPMADILTGRRLVSAMGNVQNNTSWTLRNLAAGTYFWSVQAIDNAFTPSQWAAEGTFTVSEAGGVPTSTESEIPADHFELVGSYPNPFADRATVEFAIGRSQTVRAEVFTALGEHVATMHSGPATAGTHRLVWDGKSSNGGDVGAGVYLVRLDSEEGTQTVRLVRIRP